ncbi:phage tail family protein [Bacillus smithii]|uniref:phage tail family protein n=1 Tax=Bacillus smithii TaxID=1479 RepID=UPI0030C9FEF3
MKIIKLSGEEVDTKGIKLLKLTISSPTPRIETDEVEGIDGQIVLETTFAPRKIRSAFLMESFDYKDFYLFRNEVFKIFMTKEPFYLIDDEREPSKRWKLQAESEFTIEKISKYGTFEIDFVSHQVYAESVGTTLDPFTFDSELWQFGEGLLESDDLKYVHNTSSFQIFNAGDITIDPRERPLKITFTGASNNLSITNNTTGDVWSYTGASVNGDIITLDGVRSLKNGTSIFGSTNRKLITLAPGWNDFTVTGASGIFTISFDFRFYYL